MKREKIVTVLYYFAALCFFLSAGLSFAGERTTIGAVYLCLGTAMLCLAVANRNKGKRKN